MLNKTGIRKESYGTGNQILFAVEHQVSMGIVVDKSLGVAEGSKKVVKAGTPLKGSLDDRTTKFVAATSTEATGILLHDVDVTTGDANGTLLIFGFVNTNRIDTTTKGKITAEVKKLLPMITFAAC